MKGCPRVRGIPFFCIFLPRRSCLLWWVVHIKMTYYMKTNGILASRRDDFLYIVGSSLAGFLLVAFYAGLVATDWFSAEVSLVVTFVLFSVFFDVRHLFATYARTFADRVYFQQHKRWLWSSLGWALALPMIGFFVFSRGEFAAYDSGIITLFAIRMTLVLGFYHLIKQNWGFVAIYKNKNGELDEGNWEKRLLLLGSFLPLVYVAFRDPLWYPNEANYFQAPEHQWAYLIEKWESVASACFLLAVGFGCIGFLVHVRLQYKYVSRNLAFFFAGAGLLVIGLLQWGTSILWLLTVVVASLFLFSIGKVVQSERKLPHVSREKWALIISTLVLYWGVILLPLSNKLVVVMAITLPHNVQYLAFVRFFQRRQFAVEVDTLGGQVLDHGRAQSWSRRAGQFFRVSLVYAVVFELARTGIKFVPLTANADQQFFWQNAAIVFFIGLVLHHYYLDAVIWRIRKDESIKDVV